MTTASLQARQAERETLVKDITSAAAVMNLSLDRAPIKAQVLEKVASWRKLLTEEIEDGRQLLREVLTTPIRFTADGRVYRFEGEAEMGRLFEGVAGLPTCVASPAGTHRRWKVRGDTREAA